MSLSPHSISDVSALGNICVANLYLDNNSISDIPALGNIRCAARIWLANNSISDISALRDLTSLALLRLSNNSISDAKPLVDNAGLGPSNRPPVGFVSSRNRIYITYNPLDADSVNTHIPALRARGASVDCSLVDGTRC